MRKARVVVNRRGAETQRIFMRKPGRQENREGNKERMNHDGTTDTTIQKVIDRDFRSPAK